MATSLVPQILRDFRRIAPLIRVELTQGPAHDIVRDLAGGELVPTPAGFGHHTLVNGLLTDAGIAPYATIPAL